MQLRVACGGFRIAQWLIFQLQPCAAQMAHTSGQVWAKIPRSCMWRSWAWSPGKRIPIRTPPHATPSYMWRYPISKIFKYLFKLLHMQLRVVCGGYSTQYAEWDFKKNFNRDPHSIVSYGLQGLKKQKVHSDFLIYVLVCTAQTTCAMYKLCTSF